MRAEIGPFEHAVLAAAGLVFVFAMLPLVIGGLVLLLGVRAIARARGADAPVWLLPVIAAAAALALLVDTAWFGGTDLLQVWDRYGTEQGRLASAVIARLNGSAEEVSWSALGRYLLGVLPLGLGGGAVLAAGMDLWLRSRKGSVLQVRQPHGVELGRVAQRQAQRGVHHPGDGWALGYSEQGSVLAVSDWEMRHHALVCGATGAGKTWVRDFRVQPEDLMHLGPGDAIVQVAALVRNKPRLERVRVAQPRDVLKSVSASKR